MQSVEVRTAAAHIPYDESIPNHIVPDVIRPIFRIEVLTRSLEEVAQAVQEATK